MWHSPCQNLFQKVWCPLRCQSVTLHVCRCGWKPSWISSPIGHSAHPHPLHPHHIVPFFSRKSAVLVRHACWFAQCREFKRHSHGHLLELSNNLLMSCGLQHPTQMVCYFKLCFGIWAFYPTWDQHVCNSFTATAGVACLHLPLCCTLYQGLNFRATKTPRWQCWNSSSWSISQGQSPQLCGRLVMLAHCKGWSFIRKVFGDHSLLCSIYLLPNVNFLNNMFVPGIA